MTQSQQQGRIRSFVLLVLGIGILIFLLAPQTTGDLPFLFLCFTLVPLYLFAALQMLQSFQVTDRTAASSAAPQTARRIFFQIPPPSALA